MPSGPWSRPPAVPVTRSIANGRRTRWRLSAIGMESVTGLCGIRTGVSVTTGQLNQLSYTMYLPQVSERDKVRIASPLAHDTVISNPDIPGLEVRLPAGTVVRDRKGRIVTELALVPTPVDRAPVPLPANFPVFAKLEPGKTADFLQYTPDEGWRVYGKGQVTADGSQIAREMGVEAHGIITFGANTRVIFGGNQQLTGLDSTIRSKISRLPSEEQKTVFPDPAQRRANRHVVLRIWNVDPSIRHVISAIRRVVS
jgi:hypothetical protein